MTKKIVDSEDNNSFYIEPDLDEMAKDSSFSPFKRLFGAVMERAFLDLSGKDRGYADSADEWFRREKEEDPEMFSLQMVCETLGFDFDTIQQKVLRGIVTQVIEKSIIVIETQG